MILHNLVGAWTFNSNVSTHAGHVGKLPFHYGGLFSFENDEEFEYVSNRSIRVNLENKLS